MSNYRFITSNVLTGQVLSDNLPIVGQTATRQINQIGNFQGYLPLITTGFSSSVAEYWINAVTPWKSVLWILQDGIPIWNGPITGLPHQSITDGTLPIQAASMESFFKYRQLTSQLTYTNMDIFDIFKAEMAYALNKSPNAQITGTGKYANKSGIIDTVARSGQLGSITETAGFQSVYDCWNDLVTSYGLEFALTPGLTDNTSLFTNVQLGLPQMGRPYGTTNMQMMIPGLGAVDYAWQWVPSNPCNRMVVSGSGTALVPVKSGKKTTYTTTPTTYTATATAYSDLNAGYPLLEGNSSFYGTVTSQSQINQYATNLLYGTTIQKSLTPLYTIGGNGTPLIRQTQLGDETMFLATSPLHPVSTNRGWGVSQLMRITGWTLTFPNDQQAEQTQYQLGGILVGGI
jgi:hypothetical protein